MTSATRTMASQTTTITSNTTTATSCRTMTTTTSAAIDAASAAGIHRLTDETTTPPTLGRRRRTMATGSTSQQTPSGGIVGVYQFLARLSGRRRSCHKLVNTLVKYLTIFLVFTLIPNTDACSSRTTPKPRPPTPTPRPNITFHTYKCPPAYADWYCLNEATCFTVKIGDSLLYNCECADGYMGPRCEYKDLDGSYLPSRPRVMLETASIASGATLALVLVLILCVFFYVRWHQQQKHDRLARSGAANGHDTVDGPHSVRCVTSERRPFGPHHLTSIPMADALMNR